MKARRFALFTSACDAWRPTKPAAPAFARRDDVDALFREVRVARFHVGEVWVFGNGDRWEIAWVSGDGHRVDVREHRQPRPLVWSTSARRLAELLAGASLVAGGR